MEPSDPPVVEWDTSANQPLVLHKVEEYKRCIQVIQQMGCTYGNPYNNQNKHGHYEKDIPCDRAVAMNMFCPFPSFFDPRPSCVVPGTPQVPWDVSDGFLVELLGAMINWWDDLIPGCDQRTLRRFCILLGMATAQWTATWLGQLTAVPSLSDNCLLVPVIHYQRVETPANGPSRRVPIKLDLKYGHNLLSTTKGV